MKDFIVMTFAFAIGILLADIIWRLFLEGFCERIMRRLRRR